MKEIKWGFIGCGDVAEHKSGPAFNEVAGSRVVAVMSRRESHVRSYAQRHHVGRWYTDAQELIDDPEVNAVYVATPPSSHATYAVMAMRTGKPVYVEKPLAATYEDCVRINRVSEQTGVPCYVAYYRRYMPYFQRVREIVEGGTIGKVLNVQIRFSCPPRPEDHAEDGQLPWRLQADIAGGGYFYDMAAHQLDLLQDMFGVITRAHGYCSNRGGLYQVEDTVTAAFQFEGGLNGSGSWCFVGHESARTDRIELMGEGGRLHFSVFTYEPIVLYGEGGRQEFLPENPEHVQLPLIRDVVEHLQQSGTCTVDSISATSVNWVMDRILGKI